MVLFIYIFVAIALSTSNFHLEHQQQLSVAFIFIFPQIFRHTLPFFLSLYRLTLIFNYFYYLMKTKFCNFAIFKLDTFICFFLFALFFLHFAPTNYASSTLNKFPKSCSKLSENRSTTTVCQNLRQL